MYIEENVLMSWPCHFAVNSLCTVIVCIVHRHRHTKYLMGMYSISFTYCNRWVFESFSFSSAYAHTHTPNYNKIYIYVDVELLVAAVVVFTLRFILVVGAVAAAVASILFIFSYTIHTQHCFFYTSCTMFGFSVE